MRRFALAALCAASAARAAVSVPPEARGNALFDQANAAYLSGDISRAVAGYEALLEEGLVSPELETNLGAAYLRQGKRGLAALHLERALFLDPSDDDARADLLEVRRGNVDKLEGEPEDGGAEAFSRALAALPGRASAVALAALWSLGPSRAEAAWTTTTARWSVRRWAAAEPAVTREAAAARMKQAAARIKNGRRFSNS